MPEVLTPKLTREELVRRLESLRAQCAELVKLVRETTVAQDAGSTAPTVFTPRMVAERWGCSEGHVRNLIRDNKLPVFRVGAKLVRIPLAAVEEFERRASAPNEDPAPTSKPDDLADLRHQLLTRARLHRLRQG
jgi:excisionase family DNA binding protein